MYLSRRVFLFAASSQFISGFAAALGRDDEEKIWSFIESGDLHAAWTEVDRYLSENKLDHDAVFLRARLSYALENFRAAHQDFTRIGRYAPQLRRQRGIVADINVTDIDVWRFLCERRMGQDAALPAGEAGSVNALLQGETSPKLFVEENIRRQEMIAEKLQPLTSPVPAEDGQEVVVKVTMSVPTEVLRPVLEQNAAFVLGQAALVRSDAEVAENWLKAVIEKGPPAGIPRWLEYYVARQQLRTLVP